MFGLIEALQEKLDTADYSMDKQTLKHTIKMLKFHEERIQTLEALNERLLMREKSMWNLEEVAEYLGVTNQTVYNMIRDGRIKAYKVGREWRFHPSDIESHIMLGCNIREEQNG